MITKKCFKCKRIKDIELFYKHPQMGDGYLGKCKNCTKKDGKKRWNDPDARERIREYDRLRFKDPKRRKKMSEYRIKSKLKRVGSWRTRYKLANAVRSGKVEKKPCEICGNAKSQGHHEDYRKPLCVRWLCFRHHREAHGQKVK